VIPGVGEPIPNGCVVFEGSTISYAGPREGAPPPASGDSTFGAKAVLPGLWDTHTHFTGLRRWSMEEIIYTSPWHGILRASKDAEKALRAGFTSVRELGGFGIQISRAVNEGTLPGPHIYAAGTMLSPTGGHGDSHAFPLEFVHYWARQQDLPAPCDGIPECLSAVRQVLRLGATVVKICASGGVLSDVDNPIHQQFSDEELRAIVEEAARAERIVAAHCHGKPGIIAALHAGVKTIEHGSYLDKEAADLMRQKGAILVPTRLISVGIMASGKESGMPEFMLEKERKIADIARDAFRLAVRERIPIALGTDIAGSSEATPAWWGSHGRELTLMVEEGGMAPLDAIQSATANGPLTLGAQAPKSGQLREGYAADIIITKENPLNRIALLADPENITHVWKDGRLAVERSEA
jgi:imidazolonepropionase-like amidohydrolase